MMETFLEKQRTDLPDGVPCKHPGCLSHTTHPCEGCGRVGGITLVRKSALTSSEARERLLEEALVKIHTELVRFNNNKKDFDALYVACRMNDIASIALTHVKATREGNTSDPVKE